MVNKDYLRALRKTLAAATTVQDVALILDNLLAEMIDGAPAE
jgi:hypothetical protein